MADLPNSGSSTPQNFNVDSPATELNSGLRTDFIGNSAVFTPHMDHSRHSTVILPEGDDVVVTEATVENFDRRHLNESQPFPASSSATVTSQTAPAQPTSAQFGAGLPNMAEFWENFQQVAKALREQTASSSGNTVNLPDVPSAIRNEPTPDFGDGLDNFLTDLPTTEATVKSDDLMMDMTEFFAQEDKTGPKISDDLARVLTAGFRSRVPKDRKKALLDKYLRPENCTSLKTPRVNKCIWTNMSRNTRDNDLVSQLCQNNVCTLTYPLVILLNKLQNAKRERRPIFDAELQECLQLTTDSIKIAQVAFTDLTYRREAIQPSLQPAYKELCSEDTPVSDFLFGDDIEKRVKELTDARNTTTKLAFNKGNTHGRNRSPGKFPHYQQTGKFTHYQQPRHGQAHHPYQRVPQGRSFPASKGGAQSHRHQTSRSQQSAPFLGGGTTKKPGKRT